MASDISIYPEGFERISFSTHITALYIIRDALFVAEGNEIKVYCWRKNVLVMRRTIFDSCSIHGIRTNYRLLFLFFGGKKIKFHHLREIETEKSDTITLNDWILDVQWTTKQRAYEDIIAALTAHNSLILFKEETGEIVKTYHCTENCILYSATFICTESNSIVLAVGTVFQKILIWSPYSKKADDGRSIPFHSLSGHKGVIFSINYNEYHNIICSTSDDRSLRIWRVHSANKYATLLEFFENAIIDPIYVLYGHESRVWRSLILDSCILSIGEDSFICIWSHEGKLIKRFKAHKSGSIWSIDTNIKPETQDEHIPFAFTGGSDGGVYAWDITKILQSNSITQLSKESSVFLSSLMNQSGGIETNIDYQLSTNNNQKQKKKHYPRSCSLYTEGYDENILVYMGTEKLSMYNLKSKSWQDIFLHSAISDYCVVSVMPGGTYIALGTISGDLCLINTQEISDERPVYKIFRIHNGMIRALHWCNGAENTLLSCGNDGSLSLWKVSYSETFEVDRIQQFFLPKSKNHWWSTAALYRSSQKILIVGDRGGSVNAFSHSDQESDKKEWAELVSRFPNIHGDNGVTDIVEFLSYIYSAGRDGKVHQYIFEEGELKLLNTVKACHDLEWIGKIFFVGAYIYLAGFHTKNFVVWSSLLESSIMTVECGGGHRSWDFHLTEHGEATFVAIQKKDIIYCQQDLSHFIYDSALKKGLSGQKICCLIYLCSDYYSTGAEQIDTLLCGGEDNTLRILNLSHENGVKTVMLLHSVSGHLSNIRAIAKEKMPEEKHWLFVSVGGRAQMIIWKFRYFRDGDICELLNSSQLVGCSEKSKSKSGENSAIESQTRLMDVSLSRAADLNNKNVFDIGVACSDSYFRLYLFDATSKELTLRYKFKHDENCILKIVSAGTYASCRDVSYITGASNGSLKFFKDEKYEDSTYNQLSQVYEIKNCHKSGVNALDLKFLLVSIWMICSGGDDNSLMIAFLNFDGLPSVRSQIKILAKYHHSNAHASQITGVKILDPYTIVSTSIDQRLNVWKLNYTNSPVATMTINLHKSFISTIPDIAGLDCWKSGDFTLWYLVVYGQGYELFTFKNDDKADYKELVLHFLQDSPIKIS